MAYEELVEDLIASQADIIGREAIEVAKRIDGLQVADDGAVERIDGDSLGVIDALVSAYVDDLGGAATVTLKNAAGGYADDLELPSVLA